MDCAVIPLPRYKQLSLVQTVDFFYPLLDDPFIMGKIALANVLSDVYAVGVTEIDKLQMIISAPEQLSNTERDVVIQKIMEGFKDSAKFARCKLFVDSITVNPWCILGGVATTVIKNEEIIMPYGARDGDALVLTKPLGTHLATSAYLWMQENNEKYQKLAIHLSNDQLTETFEIAVKSMTFLNKNAGILMHKHNAHAATDVTGFGLLGHTNNLALFQNESLEFKITKIPIIKNVLKIANITHQDTKLKTGKAVETSGGLLICLSLADASAFCAEFKEESKGEQDAWIVGHVEKSVQRKGSVIDNPEFLEIQF
ncbi:selenide, water dikinase 2 [Teleopsis dalmanni]|uniref:selenide, water dikinase 2 n=1 Tax=Teleopsis dalmanni TaxID=139649 RepID=UPI0018CD68F9|nr:selenide, water dikinase 2 [Teleopsis dalmanni]XP_037934339.1 selenide, water dikinase 2 [Teleopsis dalmanni]XP_037934340.1 selenide, water dikinase 2 [Teleopsis dalmanni]